MSSISEYMRDPEVSKVQMLCEKPECWAIRYDDGSAMLVDGHGDRIKSPLDRYDVVSTVEYLGRLDGKAHFVFEGREWDARNMPETGMFDTDGHQKLFRDPRSAGIEGVNYIRWEFERLEKLANDPTNSRRNDPQLVDIDAPRQSLGMRR